VRSIFAVLFFAMESTQPPEIPQLAEQMFQAKKVLQLGDQLDALEQQLASVQQLVSQAEDQLRQTISQQDLRRAIGLAFQEFELRMQEEFQQSHRTVLSQFCKKEEVQEVYTMVNKKVNWNDYQYLLSKVTELRTYIDHTAESVFLGHRDALQQEFARKADATSVDMALKAKADFTEINDLRARLERLEMLFSHSGMHHSARLDELREELTTSLSSNVKSFKASLSEHATSLSELQAAEHRLQQYCEDTAHQITEVARRTDAIEDVLPATAANIERIEREAAARGERLSTVDAALQSAMHERLQLNERIQGFEDQWSSRLAALDDSSRRADQQVDFLTQANEALKRRVREVNRTLNEQHRGLAEEKDLLEARLAKTVKELDALSLPEQLAQLQAQIDSLEQTQVPDTATPTEPAVPIADLLRKMINDAVPGLPNPSASGDPRMALPAPLPPPKSARRPMSDPPLPHIERTGGQYGLSPRFPRARG
jgi:septal ring factor EnvC (AmiA/AmiB activator)